jgi:hypothetical protein
LKSDPRKIIPNKRADQNKNKTKPDHVDQKNSTKIGGKDHEDKPHGNKTEPPKNHTKGEGKRGGPRILDDILSSNSTKSKVEGAGRKGPGRTNFTAEKAPPKIKMTMNFTRPAKDSEGKGLNGTKGTKDQTQTKGPKFSKFEPSENKGPKKFKDGAKRDSKENICKKRYQQISVTALGNLTATNSSRIL